MWETGAWGSGLFVICMVLRVTFLLGMSYQRDRIGDATCSDDMWIFNDDRQAFTCLVPVGER